MFVLGLILFVVSVGGIGVAVAGGIFLATAAEGLLWVMLPAGLGAYFLFGFLAFFAFSNARYKRGKRGAVTVFYYLTIVPYCVVNYTVYSLAEIIGYLIGTIIGLFADHFGSSTEKPKKRSGSEKKKDIASFVNNVPAVTPTSSERYQFDCKEAYTYFCSQYEYNPSDRNLAKEFEKQYFNRVYR